MGLFGGGGGGGGGIPMAIASGGDPVATLGGFAGTGGDMQSLGGSLFGTGTNAGILGVGQYKAQQYDVNGNAFTDDKAAQARRADFANQLAQYQNRAAPQMQAANINAAPQEQFRGMQLALASNLANQAEGQGPSLANMQLQQGTENNIRNQMALATSGRGGNPALAQRQVMNNAAMANQQLAQQSAMNRMQEQLNAQNQLAGVTGAGRGADIGLAENQAALQQQAAANNQNAQLQQYGLNDQMAKYFNTGISESEAQDKAAKMALEKLKADQAAGLNSSNATSFEGASTRRGNAISNLGSAVAMSDEDLKKKIKDAGPDIDKMLNQYSMKSESSQTPQSDLSNFDKVPNIKKGGGEGETVAEGDINSTPAKSATGEGGFATSGMMTAHKGGKVPFAHALACGGYAHMNQGGMPSMDMIMKLAPLAAALAARGGKVPGKAEVAGDSLKNDKVPTMLSPGEVVLPRSVAGEAVDNPDSEKLHDFLDNLKPYKYEYRDEKHGEGEHISPMAQDIEKSDLGKDMVMDTPEGKAVNYGHGFGTMLASQAHLHHRLKDLESAFKKMASGGDVSEDQKKTAESVRNAFKTPEESDESPSDSPPTKKPSDWFTSSGVSGRANMLADSFKRTR